MSAFVTVIVPSISKAVCPTPLLSFHPACFFFFCFSHWYAPVNPLRYLLSMSVCLPSPHWYALPPSTLSLTLHMIVLFSLPFFLSLSLSLLVLLWLSLSTSVSLSALLCLCLLFFPSLFLFPRSPRPPPSFPGRCCCCCCLLPSLRARERRNRRIKGQREKEVEESKLHFLLPSQVNTYVCCLSPKWRRQKTTGREMFIAKSK